MSVLIPVKSIQQTALREKFREQQHAILTGYRRDIIRLLQLVWEKKYQESKQAYDNGQSSEVSLSLPAPVQHWLRRRTLYITNKLALIYSYKR